MNLYCVEAKFTVEIKVLCVSFIVSMPLEVGGYFCLYVCEPPFVYMYLQYRSFHKLYYKLDNPVFVRILSYINKMYTEDVSCRIIPTSLAISNRIT